MHLEPVASNFRLDKNSTITNSPDSPRVTPHSDAPTAGTIDHPTVTHFPTRSQVQLPPPPPPTPLKCPLSNTPTPHTIHHLSLYPSLHATRQRTPHLTMGTWTLIIDCTSYIYLSPCLFSQFPRFGQYCRVQYGRIPECSDWLLPWGSYAIPSLSIVFKNEFTH